LYIPVRSSSCGKRVSKINAIVGFYPRSYIVDVSGFRELSHLPEFQHSYQYVGVVTLPQKLQVQVANGNIAEGKTSTLVFFDDILVYNSSYEEHV
jgi:hypothetical protein